MEPLDDTLVGDLNTIIDDKMKKIGANTGTSMKSLYLELFVKVRCLRSKFKFEVLT